MVFHPRKIAQITNEVILHACIFSYTPELPFFLQNKSANSFMKNSDPPETDIIPTCYSTYIGLGKKRKSFYEIWLCLG